MPVVEGLLDRHPDVDAIWCFNDYTAVAAGKVVRRRGMSVWCGRTEGRIVSGISGAPLAIAAIRDGIVTLTYDSLPVDAGRAAIDVLEAILVRGEEPPWEVWVDCVRYDASNVEQIRALGRALMAVNLAIAPRRSRTSHTWARTAVLRRRGDARLCDAERARRPAGQCSRSRRRGTGRQDRRRACRMGTATSSACSPAREGGARCLAPVDVNLVADEIEHVLRDSGAGVFIDGSESHEALVEGGGEAPSEPVAGDDDPLLLMYASGTSGRPKGVSLSHGSVLFTSFNQIVGWRLTADDDRALVVAPFDHVGGLVVLGLPCLHVGRLRPDGDPRSHGRDRDGCPGPRDRRLSVAPPLASGRRARRPGDARSLERPTLRVGRRASARLLRCSGCSPPSGAGFTDAYGLTEAASVSTLLPAADVLRKAGSAGLPCTHNRLRVLAPDGTEAVPEETGDLVQAGPRR